MDRQHLFELERHAEEIRQLQAKDRIPDELHIFEPEGRTEVNAFGGHAAGEVGLWHMAPFYLPRAMFLRRFLAWVAKNGGASSVTYKAALYRVSNGGAARRNGSRVSGASDGASAVGMGAVMKPALMADLLEAFTPFVTSATVPEQYRHDLREDLFLRPGFYAIGYTVSDADGLWYYGPNPTLTCGYKCHHRTSTSAPPSLEARAASAIAPHFVLRSALGIRMRPYNDEVNSSW